MNTTCAFSLINTITGKGANRAGTLTTRTRRWISSIISITSNDESSGKRVMRAGKGVRRATKGYNNMDQMNKSF